MWAIAVFFYFYQFIIRVATGNMREPLTLEFNLTASQYGLFASYWLISYSVLQIPIGIALDRWGTKKVLSISAVLCGVGTLIMAQTHSFMWLCFARLLIGAGSASAFLGAFKVSSEWFSSNLLPVLVGVISGVGVLGASLAGAPMVLLQDAIGWRILFYGLSFTAFMLAVVCSIFLNDKRPPKKLKFTDIRRQMTQLLTEPQIWLLGTLGFILYTPVSVLADLWGPSFMSSAYGYTNVEAAFATSFVFYGNAVGSFLAGWVFLKFTTNKRYFAFFMAIAGFLMTLLVWMILPHFGILCLGLFCLGCMVGAENMVFPLGARYATPENQGLSASVINFLVMVGAILLQPSIGLVMDVLWEGTLVDGHPVYSVSQYRWGLSSLIGILALGFVLSFRLKGKTSKA